MYVLLNNYIGVDDLVKYGQIRVNNHDNKPRLLITQRPSNTFSLLT